MVADIFQDTFQITSQQSWSALGATFGFVAIISIMTTALNIKERKRADFVPIHAAHESLPGDIQE